MDPFAIRYGHEKYKKIQIDSIDVELKNRIWNTLDEIYIARYIASDSRVKNTEWKRIFHGFFKIETHVLSDELMFVARQKIKTLYDELEWYKVYSLIEFLLQNSIEDAYKEDFINQMNVDLESEMSGFRIIDNFVTNITNEQELEEVRRALTHVERISEHIKAALGHYSNRPLPDYRNSIKESISAVESACQMINGSKETLGDALKKLKKSGFKLPEALANGFNSIYGYTNSSDGIRHAMMELPNLSEEDARFMLVACSAFTNYLIVKYEKIK